ncbi:peptidoglycan DD-metalloendopeptidase family protein [Candidatus Pacebacteria bacterium]|nr:peptidoglycan DD-metalloendopeptidase family protein [Candidatus Paceibacterota bacterium]
MTIKTLVKRRLVTGLVLVAFLFIPYFANAGIFSLKFWNRSSSEDTELSSKPISNSQTVALLKAAVNNDPNPAKGGGDILVVDDKALMATPSITGDATSIYKPKSDKISVYEVRDGDSLSQIAEMFGVSTNTIRWANDLEGAIQPGETLVILPVTGVTHTIKTGGTVKDLADIYNADAKEIALFNGISMDTELKPGDEVVVPNGVVEEKEQKKVDHSTGTKVAATTGSSAGGFMSHPLPGSIRTQGIHGYNGVDFGASVGTPIYAAAGGQVIISKGSGWNGGYGNYVVIKHDNGAQTLYAHMSSTAIGSGAWASKGQVIGYVGNTGRSTGPHLHFEVRGARNPF